MPAAAPIKRKEESLAAAVMDETISSGKRLLITSSSRFPDIFVPIPPAVVFSSLAGGMIS